MSTTLELIELSTVSDEDDDEMHLVCEFDGQWSLCGQDMSAHDWVADDYDGPECACCEEFDREDFCAHCAMAMGES